MNPLANAMVGLWAFLFCAWLFSLYMAFLAGRSSKQKKVNRELLEQKEQRDEIEQANADISDADLDAGLRRPKDG